MKVLTTKSPPELKSSNDDKAASKALFKPSSSPGSAPIVNQLSNSRSGKAAKKGGFTPPPQCMPEEYRDEDTVEAYRKYYIGEKAGFAKWKAREVPEWFNV